MVGAAAATTSLVLQPPAVVPSPPISRDVDVPAEDYRVSASDPRELVLGLTLGVGDAVLGASATETASTVTVRVRVRQDLHIKAALGVPTTTTVTLRDPLGARTVVDASGRTLVQRR